MALHFLRSRMLNLMGVRWYLITKIVIKFDDQFSVTIQKCSLNLTFYFTNDGFEPLQCLLPYGIRHQKVDLLYRSDICRMSYSR